MMKPEFNSLEHTMENPLISVSGIALKNMAKRDFAFGMAERIAR